MVKEDIQPVLARIREKRGIDFSQYRDGTMRRRLSRRMTANKCADLASYCSLLDSDASEYERLICDLTIKYTEFFRNPCVFDIIREDILPDILVGNRKNGRETVIWSAGCATGEEAYSLASLILSSDMFRLNNNRVRIIGTDIDPAALDTARAGVYIKDYLPKPPEYEAAHYFTNDGKKVTAFQELKDLVSFYTHDMTAPSAAEDLRAIWPGKFDLILCRNLMIYLQRTAQTKVLELCREALRPGGFLILGTGETMPRVMQSELKPHNMKVRAFRRELAQDEEVL